MAIRVMVVDDSRFVYEEMAYLLEGSGFELAGYCKCGEDALAGYQELRPDLVTMDIILPGIDGFESAGLILEDDPQAKIVFVSSLAYDDTIEEAKKLGIEEFLFKPFEKQRLIDTLTRASQGKSSAGA